MLRLHLLGTPLIRADDRPLSVPSQKAQALLFYLAAEAERRIRDVMPEALIITRTPRSSFRLRDSCEEETSRML